MSTYLSYASSHVVLKYTTNYKARDPAVQQKPSFIGNNTKSMHVSVKDSLKKLRTDYIDILYVHWWDFETPIEEVMNGLHNLVVQGKVLYLVGHLVFTLSIHC